MMMDVDQAAKAMRDDEMLAEIEDFIEGINRPIHSRYADQRPACLYIVIPARMVWGYKARGRVDHPMTRLLQRQCKI
jgi:hypothetical protein